MNRTQTLCVGLWLLFTIVGSGCASYLVRSAVDPLTMAQNLRDAATGNVALHRCETVTVLMTWADHTQSPLALNVCRVGATATPPKVDGLMVLPKAARP